MNRDVGFLPRGSLTRTLTLTLTRGAAELAKFGKAT